MTKGPVKNLAALKGLLDEKNQGVTLCNKEHDYTDGEIEFTIRVLNPYHRANVRRCKKCGFHFQSG